MGSDRAVSDQIDKWIKQAKAKRKHRLSSQVNVDAISAEDYYRYSKPFRLFCLEHQDIHFSEVPSDRAKRWFETKFVPIYNARALDRLSFSDLLFSKYYEDINAVTRTSAASTPHAWHIHRSKEDEKALASLAESSSSSSHHTSSHLEKESKSGAGPASFPHSSGRAPAHNDEEDPDRRQIERLADRHEYRREKRSRKEDLDELLPSHSGREKKMAVQKERNAQNRSFAEAKKDNVHPEIDERVLLGQGQSYTAALAAQRQAQQRRDEKKEVRQAAKWQEGDERRAQMAKKEDETMQMLRKMAAERFGSGSA